MIIVSFLDSQLAFCSMQTIPKQEKKKARGSHEQVSDIEYIIPRVGNLCVILPNRFFCSCCRHRGPCISVSLLYVQIEATQAPFTRFFVRSSHEVLVFQQRKSSKPHTVYNAYSQSWVYDADTAATVSVNNHHTTETSPYLQVSKEDTPKHSIGRRRSCLENGIINDTTHLIDNPVVHVEEASDDSNSNSDRKLCYMKSFSRLVHFSKLSFVDINFNNFL